MSNIIVMAFSPRNIVGCFLKKMLTKGGGGSRAPQDPPFRYALVKAFGADRFSQSFADIRSYHHSVEGTRQRITLLLVFGSKKNSIWRMLNATVFIST